MAGTISKLFQGIVFTSFVFASSTPSHAATYVSLYVPVPKVPQVTTPLPANVSFWVDSRFSTAERDRLRATMVSLLTTWQYHYAQRAASGRSVYQNCANTYASLNLKPSWFSSMPANGAAAASLAMDGFTRQIVANGFNRAGSAYVNYEVPTSSLSYFTIKASAASNPDTSPLTITANPRALARTDLSILTLAGSLHHAWLHRQGYSHPSKTHTSYFMSEAAMCVMRDNTNKLPGSDAAYSIYLD